MKDIENIKTPADILDFMDEIDYGYVDVNGEKHIQSLKGIRTLYRTLSIDNILKYRIGTCIEQVFLMHYLLDSLGIKNKMFCTRVYESGEVDSEKEEHMHCFILYYDDEGVHQIEHPNWERKGIYHFKDEQEAIEKINKIYVEMAAGEARPVTEFFTVDEGLSFKDFNDYVNSLDEYNLKK